MANHSAFTPEDRRAAIDTIDAALDRAGGVAMALNALARLANFEDHRDMGAALAVLADALSAAAAPAIDALAQCRQSAARTGGRQ